MALANTWANANQAITLATPGKVQMGAMLPTKGHEASILSE